MVTSGDAPKFPKSFIEFLKLFNAELYWESHEVLEQPWRENRSNFYQGLIIFASGFVHAQRGNPTGVRKQMLKARRYLDPYRPHYMGIDVDAVLQHIVRCVAVVEGGPDLSGLRLREAVPFMRLTLHKALVRGHEREFSDPAEDTV